MATDLPIEIITLVMKELSISDRKEAALVCHKWYEASLDPMLLRDTVVLFHGHTSTPEQITSIGRRKPSHLILDQFDSTAVSRNMIDKTCISLAENLLSLCLKGSNISENLFIQLLSHCYNLESLDISGCNSLFMTGQLLSKPKDIKTLRIALKNVTSLNLSSIRYLSDDLFNKLTSVFTSLTDLNISGNKILFHTQDYTLRAGNTSLLTYRNFLNFVCKHVDQLTSLSFDRTSIGDADLKILVEIGGLHLKKLSLVCCRELGDEGIVNVAKNLTSLEILDISQSYGIGSPGLSAVNKNLENLKELKLNKCRQVNDLSVATLHKLKKLRLLDLSSCYTLSTKGVTLGLCKSMAHLQHLNLNCCKSVKDNFIVEACKTLTNLTHLDVGSCGITDVGLQFICRYMKSLRFLRLCWCPITDKGLLGKQLLIDVQHHLDHEEDGACKCTRKEFGIDVLNLPKKKNTSYTTNGLPDDLLISINNLQYLNTLDLTACIKITDQSIQEFQFNELQSLTLSMCKHITDESLYSLSKNIPSLEHIGLNQCIKITDAGIISIAKNFKRLLSVDVSSCDALTNKCIDALMEHCTRLRFLDVSLCGSITHKEIDKLEGKLKYLQCVQKRLIHGINTEFV